MKTLFKAIETGKFIELFSYKEPIEYGYIQPKGDFKKLGLKTDKETIKRISMKRAKDKIRRLIIGNIHHHPEIPVFLTLTFKENLTSLKEANKKFTLFIKRFNYYLGFQLRYIATPEYQERGAVHYHMMIFNQPFIKGKFIEENIWKYGGTNIKKIYRGNGLFMYITKYVSKSFSDDRFKGHKRYFYSLLNHSENELDEDRVIERYENIPSEYLIKELSYDMKDKNGIIVNSVKKLEFLLLNQIYVNR